MVRVTVQAGVMARATVQAGPSLGTMCMLQGLQASRKGRQSVCWLLARLTSQQRASVSQGPICSNSFTCCHTDIQVADQTYYLAQSQYTDTGPTSRSADPITPGVFQGRHWRANFKVNGMTRPSKIPTAQAGIDPRICRSRGGRLNHWAKKAVHNKLLMSTSVVANVRIL